MSDLIHFLYKFNLLVGTQMLFYSFADPDVKKDDPALVKFSSHFTLVPLKKII